MAEPKQMWNLRFVSIASQSVQDLRRQSTMSMQLPREVRSLAIEKKTAVGRAFLVILISMDAFAICALILLISIQVLTIPSAATPRKKLICPNAKKHMLPAMTERYPVKNPRQVDFVTTWLRLNLATSILAFLAIFLVLMVSKGYATICAKVVKTPVVKALCTILGSFLTFGILSVGCS